MTRALVLDANLLVLLVVGLTDSSLILKHKRTRNFQVDDLALLKEILERVQTILVTPHIAAEASNLIGQTDDVTAAALRLTLGRLLSSVQEKYEPSTLLVEEADFPRLGLTDAGVLRLAREQIPVLTADLGLYIAASKLCTASVNFNHLRQERWFG